jgi:two-component system, OmpR family, phosphate regulon sensor histidine kinase PhoR
MKSPPAKALFFTALLRVVLIGLFVGVTGVLVGGWAFGFAMMGLVALAGFLYHAWKLAQLSAWLSSDLSAASMPDGWGVWGETLGDLYRLLRTERNSMQSLSDALARFQQAASALPDGAVMLDHDNNMVWCNPMAESHWQVSLANDRMQTITYFIRYPEFSAYLAERKFNEPLTLRFSRPSAVGAIGRAQELTLAVQLVEFGNDQMLLLSRDISERERLETMRTDFVANVSHELRTPLTVMSGFLETLQQTTRPDVAANVSPDVVQRSLAHMSAQTERMRTLVDDLLMLSRLEDTHNKLNETVVDMRELVNGIVGEARVMSRARHTVSADLVDAWLVGNRDEIRSAVTNLVANAVRYTPEGGTISVESSFRDDELIVTVRDNGEGIAPEHIPRLTERFYRVDRGRSRDVGGTGLGLAIVKHVLMRHQGRIEIESSQQSEDHGATFRLIFPATRTRSEQPRLQAVAA